MKDFLVFIGSLRKIVWLCFSAILFIVNAAFSQGPLVKQWDKRFGGLGVEELTSFQQTSDGGYILGGKSKSGIGGDKTQANWDTSQSSDDYWIVKIDSLGGYEWDKRLGGIGDDWLTTLQQTSDEGYILGGHSGSRLSGDKTQNSHSNSSDYWVVKTDSLGNKLWDKDLGGTDGDILNSLQQTSDGGYILGGYSYSGISGDKTQNLHGLNDVDYWIVKINSLGNKLWDKDLGGYGWDYLISIRQTSDGGFILGGVSYSGIGGDKTQISQGSADYWIVKTDSLGNKLWDKNFGGTDGDFFRSLQQTLDGGYILGGFSFSGIGGDKSQDVHGFQEPDYWVLKIDSLGNKEWDKDFGGFDDEESFGNVTQTLDNGYLIAGAGYSNIGGDKSENNLGYEQSWIVKIDSLGIKQWDKTIFTLTTYPYWGDQIGLAIQTGNGCYTIANYTDAGIAGYKTQPCWGGQGEYDYWIIKFCDSTQYYPPASYFASTPTEFCSGNCTAFQNLSLRSNSWQWIFHSADDSTSIDANPQNICYTTPGIYDVTLISYNANGSDTLTLPAYITVYPEPIVPSILQSADTLIAQTGYTSYQWYYFNNLIPGATDYFYVATQNGDYSVVVMDSNGCDAGRGIVNVLTGENSLYFDLGDAIRIVPNPSSMIFRIDFNPNFFTNQTGTFSGKNIQIEIVDVFGKIIYSEILNISSGNNSKQIQLDAPAGIYFVKVNDGEHVMKAKIVLQK